MISEDQIPKRIRQARLDRDLTQKELADAVGISKGYMSRIENGVSAPPVSKMIAIAERLGFDLKHFFEAEDPDAYITVTRKRERLRPASGGMLPADLEQIGPDFPDRVFKAYTISIPEAAEKSPVIHRRGQGLLYVKRGEVRFRINGQAHILDAGDALQFNAGHPHGMSCLSKGGAEVIGIFQHAAGAGE